VAEERARDSASNGRRRHPGDHAPVDSPGPGVAPAARRRRRRRDRDVRTRSRRGTSREQEQCRQAKRAEDEADGRSQIARGEGRREG
jgi:hypothetical protein